MKEKTNSASSQNVRPANALRLRVGADGQLLASISKSSGEFFMSPEVLELIRLVAQGKSKSSLHKELKKALSETVAKMPEAEEIEDILGDLFEAGVLIQPEGNHRRKLQADGFGDPWVQWTMLADSKRTQTYIKSLETAVTENSHVLDVGSGSGVLSAACLQAGAASVTAIEETDIATVIKETLRRLKLPMEKFKLFQGNSDDFPVSGKKFNLVVSELFGNDPFCEGVLPTLRSLSARLGLKNSSQFIPRSFQCYVELVDLVDAPMRGRVAALQKINSGQSVEKQNFVSRFLRSSLETFQISQISFPFALRKNDFRRASESVSLGAVTLSPPAAKLNYSGKKEVKLKELPNCPVALLWFRAQIDDKATLSSHPLESDFAEHWSPILIPLLKMPDGKQPLTVKYALNDEEDFLQVSLEQDGQVLAKR